jgi:hypothetical protein
MCPYRDDEHLTKVKYEVLGGFLGDARGNVELYEDKPLAIGISSDTNFGELEVTLFPASGKNPYKLTRLRDVIRSTKVWPRRRRLTERLMLYLARNKSMNVDDGFVPVGYL